jgi:hypothetical protein
MMRKLELDIGKRAGGVIPKIKGYYLFFPHGYRANRDCNIQTQRYLGVGFDWNGAYDLTKQKQ